MLLNNKVVAISGAAGRIGSVFSNAVIENGGKVFLGDISEEKGKTLERSLGLDKAFYVSADLTDPSDIDLFIQNGIQRFGRLDAAVHCAYPVSAQWGTRFEDLKPEFLSVDLNRQLGGAILFSQRFIRYFRKLGCGNLVHLSSIQGVSPPKFEHYEGTKMVSPIEYSAIKAGIIAVTKYLAKYCKGENIRVNCISPGGILDRQPESFLKKYRNSCLNKGMLDATDLSGTLIYLLTDHSRYLNGQNIVIDDGWSL